MATVNVGHHPELTKESAMEVFSRHLGGKYTVCRATGMERWLTGRADLVVRKTTWVGVGVWVRQRKDTTSIAFGGMIPPIAALGLLAGGLGVFITNGIAWMILRPSWKAVEVDIRSCVENASEFN